MAPDHGITVEMRGRALVLLAGAVLSTGSLFVRLTSEATSWQIVFYRSIFLAAFLSMVFLVQRRGNLFEAFREAGWTGLFAGAILSGAFIFFIFALQYTTVAQSLFLLSFTPFLTAILARLILGERTRRATGICMIVAVGGVGIMVQGDIVNGTVLGAIFALSSAVCFSFYSVILRSGRARDMSPAVCVAGIVSAVISGGALIVEGVGFDIPLADVGWTMAMGVGHLGIGLILYTIGSRNVAAPELTLLNMTEVILGPLWVWIVIGETFAMTTLVGGIVVLVAVAANALSGIRRKFPPVGGV